MERRELRPPDDPCLEHSTETRKLRLHAAQILFEQRLRAIRYRKLLAQANELMIEANELSVQAYLNRCEPLRQEGDELRRQAVQLFAEAMRLKARAAV